MIRPSTKSFGTYPIPNNVCSSSSSAISFSNSILCKNSLSNSYRSSTPIITAKKFFLDNLSGKVQLTGIKTFNPLSKERIFTNLDFTIFGFVFVLGF
jgi:hypothetical protein